MKEELIESIKNILKTYGCFDSSELDYKDNSVCVGTMGKLVALAEYFTEDYAQVYIYNPTSFSSDPVDEYQEQYEDLSVDVLQEILVQCEQWEAQSLQTEKRISN